jgi:hypothetical protein
MENYTMWYIGNLIFTLKWILNKEGVLMAKRAENDTMRRLDQLVNKAQNARSLYIRISHPPKLGYVFDIAKLERLHVY